jgi:hypothetical protein
MPDRTLDVAKVDDVLNEAARDADAGAKLNLLVGLDIESSSDGDDVIGAEILNEGGGIGADVEVDAHGASAAIGVRVVQRGPGVGLRIVQSGPGVGLRSVVVVRK